MTKYAIVPVEATEEMLDASIYNTELDDETSDCSRMNYDAILAARPPLDAKMQQALELAREVLKMYKELEDEGKANPNVTTDEESLARALLRANGEEA